MVKIKETLSNKSNLFAYIIQSTLVISNIQGTSEKESSR